MAEAGLARLDEVLSGHVERGVVPGAAWLLARRGAVHTGVAGTQGGDGARIADDTIFRISSMTKPVTAVAALILLEECRIRLDEPVDEWLPELADRKVMVDPDGALDETVPADRPITVRDLLTFRLGLGLDFARFGRQPALDALAGRGLSAGPPQPAAAPAPDDFLRAFESVPLEFQPGTRWQYHLGADVLGVLVSRVAGQPFGAFLAERIFEPLGMVDTGFSVPPEKLDRFGPCWVAPPEGERQVFDPADGQWSREPVFQSGGGGLVSTLADYLAFAEMLRGMGAHPGGRILSRPSVEFMTTDQLTDDQRATASPDPSGAVGWGCGVGVVVRRLGPDRPAGSYGWDGGLGSSWTNDPTEGIVGIVLTNQMWSSPEPPALFQHFWTAAYAAIDD